MLCEFTTLVAKTRRRDQQPSELGAFEYVRAIRERFPIAVPGARASELAIDIHVREQVSIWDAMLLAACVDAGVTRLYSEDMQSRPTIRGVTIINPFA